jgi:hypothetical protein
MPHSPGALGEYFDQIRNAVVLGDAVGSGRQGVSESAKLGTPA